MVHNDGAVAAMTNLWREAALGQPVEEEVVAFPLQMGVGLVGVVGLGEMGEEAAEFNIWQRQDFGDLIQAFFCWQEADAAHAGVAFDVDHGGFALFNGGIAHGFGEVVGKDGLLDVVFNELGSALWFGVAENENRHIGEAGVANFQGFVEQRHTEKIGAVLQQGWDDFDGTMAVSVGLDDGGNVAVFAGAFADRGNGEGERIEINLGPNRTDVH